MKKISFTVIIDSLFVAFASFLLLFTAFYYFMPRKLAIVCGTTLAIVFAIFSFAHLYKKSNNLKLKKKEKQAMDDCLFSLCTEKHPLGQKRVYYSLKKKYPSARQGMDRIYLPDINSTAFTVFNFEGLTKSNVVKIFNTITKDRKVIIYTAYCSEEIISFANRFDGKITIVHGEEVYTLLKENGQLPLAKEIAKIPVTEKLKRFVNKKNFIKYFLLGGSFIGLSFLLPMKVYYITCGSVMILLSLLCLLFGKEKPKTVN